SLVAVLVLAAPAGAQEIAQINDQVPISAHAGWVAWSAKVNGRYRLFSWHDGLTRMQLVPGRSRPFDVDVGTDARGRAIATYSRCRRWASVKVYTARVVGVRCRIRVVDLISGHEHDAGVPEPPGTSDTTPSMWHGRIAFGRRDRAHHRDVDQIMLWSPQDRRLRRLPHGAVPMSCPYRDPGDCTFAPPSGRVLGLDLGARLVAFSWRIDAPSVIGHGGYEVRVDQLADGRSALVGSGYIGEACTSPGPDGTSPAPPAVDGDRIWYSQTTTSCYSVSSTLNSYRAFPVSGRRGPLTGIVLQAVQDRGGLYGLVAPPNAPNEGPRCTPCTLEHVAMPPLHQVRRKPASPFT
ncbi:MAG TPA: hypothetical protein VFL73_00565, partial [Solirubrobacteraceae bacterium]|nr:hypothetical protein [Solirubrobacteraceae bacterium]